MVGRLKEYAGRNKDGSTFIVGRDADQLLRDRWLYRLGLTVKNANGAVFGWTRAALLRIGVDFDTDRVNRTLQEEAEKGKNKVLQNINFILALREKRREAYM